MPNDARIANAVGMLTAVMHNDEDVFYELAGEFDGGCPEALLALARVGQAIVRMWAQEADTPTDEMWRLLAESIAFGDLADNDGQRGDNGGSA